MPPQPTEQASAHPTGTYGNLSYSLHRDVNTSHSKAELRPRARPLNRARRHGFPPLPRVSRRAHGHAPEEEEECRRRSPSLRRPAPLSPGRMNEDQSGQFPRPKNPQASLANLTRRRVAVAGAAEESFEIDPRLARQCGVRILRPACADLGERPGGSFGFHASKISADAPPPVPDNRQMPPQTSSLKMFSANQPPFHHRGRSHAGSERHHYDVVAPAGGAGESFSQQRHTGVVLDPQRQAELCAAHSVRSNPRASAYLPCGVERIRPAPESTIPGKLSATPTQSDAAIPARFNARPTAFATAGRCASMDDAS